MANYSKWDKIDCDDDDDSKRSNSGRPSVIPMVDDAESAEQRALKAKAEGKAPNPLDDLFTLRGESGAEELLAKMRNLPPEAKTRFLEQMEQPGMLQKLSQQAEALKRGVAPAEAGKLMIGMRVKLTGLKAQPGLNGKQGKVIDFVEDKGRCAVLLDGQDKPKLLKSENLERAIAL